MALAWALVVFLAGQMAYLVVLERWRPDLRDPEYGCKLALLRPRLKNRPLLLALGSSRMDLGFRPDVLPTYRLPDGQLPLVYNYGLTGAGPVQELVLLRRLLALGVRPRWLLVEVLPAFLHAEGPLDAQLRVDQLGWRDLRRLDRSCTCPQDLYARWFETEAFPWFAHRYCFMSRYAPGWLPFQSRLDYIWHGLDSSGWFACHSAPASPDEHRRWVDKVRSDFGGAFRDFHVSSAPDQALRELLALCRREGIAVTLILAPEASEFRGWYPDGARAAVATYLAGLCRTYQVPVIDASDWVDDEDFFDNHHLLARGARVFTERLGRELLRRWIEGGPTEAR
jgi:hypothetical protein